MKLNRRIIVTAIPIVGVNLTSVIAQLEFWRAHLPTWGIAGQLLFSISLESVAIMLCYFAHLAMVSTDSAFKLRLSAILFALGIATINGSHYVTRAGAITAASIGVFVCSAMSPILWGVCSRRASRDILISNGLIEPGSVRLGSARWLFHPRKSFHVFSRAIWHGERNPQIAITAYETAMVVRVIPEPVIPEPVIPEPVISEPVIPEPVIPEPVITKADALRQIVRGASPEPAALSEPAYAGKSGSKAEAVRQAVHDAPDNNAASIAAHLATQGVLVSAAYVRTVRSVESKRVATVRREAMRARK